MLTCVDCRLVVQVNCDVSVATKHQTVQGVAFPLSEQAVSELTRLRAGKINYVQLVCVVTSTFVHQNILVAKKQRVCGCQTDKQTNR